VKDIDFDELDKAVNSLMADVPKTSVSNDPPEKTVEITTTDTTTPVANDMPVPITPALQPVKAPEEPKMATLQATPASRRGGRFMDVVHPSSDMKKPETPRISRQGATIAPRATPVQPEHVPPVKISTDTSESPADAEHAKNVIESVSLDEPAVTPKTDWPDPLDMAGFGEKSKSTSSASEPTEPVGEEKSEPVTVPEEPVNEPPLTSPFLPDMKVEKRPLGGNVLEEPPKEDDGDLPRVINEDEQLPATADDVKPLLPDELHSDLVAIESDTTEPKEAMEEKTEASTTPKTEKPSAWVEPTKEEKPEEAAVPVGPASIPQQYREEPSTGDQKNGAIYDTANYHQPLAHPAKQKSGWMWVVWIVLILIIGAGGGAALYFLHIV
jgi:hypothetical protein